MNYGKSIFKICSLAMALAFGACTVDDSDNSPLVEFGAITSEFTVPVDASYVTVELLSNQQCRLSFLGDTPWAQLSTTNISGDASFYVDVDNNPGFPRMAQVLVESQGTGLLDTIFIKQCGAVTPTLAFPVSTLLLQGSMSGSDEIQLDTNIDFSEINTQISYTSNSKDWITGVTYTDGKLQVAYDQNSDADEPRTATVKLNWVDGWDKTLSETLYITQKTSNDALGRDATFEEIRNMGEPDVATTIDDFVMISGYIISDVNSGNVGENPKTTETSIDYTVCKKTVYFESLDGQYGFQIVTDTEDDNIYRRYDKVTLLLKGATITRQINPNRYTLKGIKPNMVVSRELVSSAEIPVKEKYIVQLADEDIYTFVTLKDCEFPVRQGTLTPIHEGYAIGDNVEFISKYPRLMRDIQGKSIYLYTNTTCPYRRAGTRLPYGSGKISGVVVFEYFPGYIYGDGADEESHGNIGRYQLRHMAYEDIKFDDKESFSALLTEYRYIKDKKTDTKDNYTYWYPTYGSNGRFTHSASLSDYKSGCYRPTTWNYIGEVGTKRGIAPFKDHIGDDGSGLGIILEDGTNYDPKSDYATCTINDDGRGQVKAGDGWLSRYWWNVKTDKPEAWRIEFSTAGIETDHLSMQFTVQSGRKGTASPIFWKAQWSQTGDLTKDEDWTDIGEYQVPDFPNDDGRREWQLAAYKQIDMELPLEMLNLDKVYIRLLPANNKANSITGFATGTVATGADSGSSMDYFAIRYNKK